MTDHSAEPVDPYGRTGTAGSGDPVRDVFRRALRDMLVLVAVLAVVGVAAGALLAHPASAGVWGAVIGVVIALVFSGTTVLTMLMTAQSPVTTTAAVILGGWLVKMIVLIATLVVLGDQHFYDRKVLVGVLLAGVLGSALLDYRAVAKGRVPYVSPAA